MGQSIAFQQEVSSLISKRVGVTLSVTLPAFIIAVILGILLGVLAAVNRGKPGDSIITSIANIGIAMPQFWVGILLVYLLSLKFKWLPVQGYTPLSENFLLGLKQLIMPVTVLALGPLVAFTRQTRSAMLEVVQQDYIRTARSKGLKENSVIIGHALRNALIPLITMMGMAIGGLVGGSVIIEKLFVIPGIGSMLITAITNKDYLVVQNTVFLIAASIAVCNLLVDIVYSYVDPRIRID
jgi:peptide/nickel transport system permease protein